MNVLSVYCIILVFRQHLVELEDFIDEFNVEQILTVDETEWTAPKWAVEGDIVFFFSCEDSDSTNYKVGNRNEKEKEWMKESDWFEMFGDALGNYEQVSLDDDIRWQALQRARELYKKIWRKDFCDRKNFGKTIL